MPENFDIVIIGAGFSGLYAIHKLRKKHTVVCFEAGDGVGGTWYWNRYPGARVDIKSVEYSYGFDEDLQQEWKWPEVFSAQPDLERYANHVADRFDLRRHIRFSNAVKSLTFDQDTNRWHVQSANGDHVICKHIIAATGALSAPNMPDWPGRESFQGETYHTTQWPRQQPDLSGKRVGIIGTRLNRYSSRANLGRAQQTSHRFSAAPRPSACRQETSLWMMSMSATGKITIVNGVSSCSAHMACPS